MLRKGGMITAGREGEKDGSPLTLKASLLNRDVHSAISSSAVFIISSLEGKMRSCERNASNWMRRHEVQQILQFQDGEIIKR